MTGSRGRGQYSNEGNIPELNDERIRFVKGWFQNTVEPFISEKQFREPCLVVHYDADLYSSTLYTLM